MKNQFSLSAGATFGAYRIDRPIGSGGMGDVYEAHQNSLDRKVALKVMNESSLQSSESIQRFLAEAKSLARVRHQNVVALLEFGQVGTQHYMAMEYVEGVGLDEFIKSHPYGVEEALQLFRQILEGIAAAHAEGIIHRDLKPQNILIRRDRTAKIIDFGIAKSQHDSSGINTATGVFMGTLNYLAPETARGERATIRTDIHALGLILFEMLTGRTPFSGKNNFETLEMIRNQPLQFPRKFEILLPEAIQRLIYKMTAKNPAQRFGAVREALDALANINLQDLPAELKGQTVRTPKILNFEKVKAVLTEQGFEGPEIKMIVGIACEIQSEQEFDPNATINLSLQDSIELKPAALQEASGRFRLWREELRAKRILTAAPPARPSSVWDHLSKFAAIAGISVIAAGIYLKEKIPAAPPAVPSPRGNAAVPVKDPKPSSPELLPVKESSRLEKIRVSVELNDEGLDKNGGIL